MPPVAILSPHLDDAVFSCWHVLASTHDVLTLNVFTAVPRAGLPAPPWDLMTGAVDAAARMRQRLLEDEAALALVGRCSEHLGFLDSQYRDAMPEGLFEAVERCLPHEATVLAPAAIGGHPDHELLRDVGVALAGVGHDVSFYAEIPYATEFGWPEWMSGEEPHPFRNIDAYWDRFRPAGYEPRPVELSETEQRAKIKAMRTYRTQFEMLEARGQRRLTLPELTRFELTWVKPI